MQEAVLVDPADVTDRDVAVAIDLAAPFVLVEVGEAGPVTGRPDVHLPGLARRQPLAGGVEHVDVGVREWPADGSLVSEPLVAVAGDDDPDLGRSVVLEDHRPEPLDHAPLDVDGARRGRVDDALERAEVVARADVVGELQQAHEHRRDCLGVRDPLRFDEPQELLGLEPRHDRQLDPEREREQALRVRSRVIHRRGDQRPHARPQAHRRQRDRRHLLRLLGGHRVAQDALGQAGRARRVDHAHSRAPRLVGVR